MYAHPYLINIMMCKSTQDNGDDTRTRCYVVFFLGYTLKCDYSWWSGWIDELMFSSFILCLILHVFPSSILVSRWMGIGQEFFGLLSYLTSTLRLLLGVSFWAVTLLWRNMPTFIKQWMGTRWDVIVTEYVLASDCHKKDGLYSLKRQDWHSNKFWLIAPCAFI